MCSKISLRESGGIDSEAPDAVFLTSEPPVAPRLVLILLL
jgi:hypothetical protein